MHDRVRALLMPCMHQEAMRGARAPRRHSIAKLLGRYMHNMSCPCMCPSIYPLILLYMVHYMSISLCVYIYIYILFFSFHVRASVYTCDRAASIVLLRPMARPRPHGNEPTPLAWSMPSRAARLSEHTVLQSPCAKAMRIFST